MDRRTRSTETFTPFIPWSADSLESSSANAQTDFSDEEFIGEEAQSFMHLSHLDKKQISLLPTDEEVLTSGGEVYAWSWEDMMQCPLLAKVVKDAGRELDTENNSEVSQMDVIKSLKPQGKLSRSLIAMKTETPLTGNIYHYSSDCLNTLNTQTKNLKERETHLSLTSSGYSSMAPRYSNVSNRSTNDAKNLPHLLKEIKVMNVVSVQQCPLATSVDKLSKQNSDSCITSSPSVNDGDKNTPEAKPMSDCNTCCKTSINLDTTLGRESNDVIACSDTGLQDLVKSDHGVKVPGFNTEGMALCHSQIAAYQERIAKPHNAYSSPELMVHNFRTISPDSTQDSSQFQVMSTKSLSKSLIPNTSMKPHFMPPGGSKVQHSYVKSTSKEPSSRESESSTKVLPSDSSCYHDYHVKVSSPHPSQTHILLQCNVRSLVEPDIPDPLKSDLPSGSLQNSQIVTITPDPSNFCVYDATSLSTDLSLQGDSVEYMPLLESKSQVLSVDLENVSLAPSQTYEVKSPSSFPIEAHCYRLSPMQFKSSLSEDSSNDNHVDISSSQVDTTSPDYYVDNLKSSSVETDHENCVKTASLQNFLDISSPPDENCSAYSQDYFSEQNAHSSSHLGSALPCMDFTAERSEVYCGMNSHKTAVEPVNSSLPNIAGIRYGGQYIDPGQLLSLYDHDQLSCSEQNPCTSMQAGATVPAPKLPIAGFSNYIRCANSPEVLCAASQSSISNKNEAVKRNNRREDKPRKAKKLFSCFFSCWKSRE